MATPTVTVTAGSTSVVGTGTAFIERAGDLFLLAGLVVQIGASTPGTLTLRQPWPGPTLTDRADFATQRSGPYWSTNVTTNTKITELIDKLDAAGAVKFDAAGTLAGRTAYDNQPAGFVYLATMPAPWTLYAKLANTGAASDWSAGQRASSPPQATAEAEEAATRAQAAQTVATQKAGAAEAAAGTAMGKAVEAVTGAGTATGAAGTASSQAGVATTQAGVATGAAGIATTQAGVAASQAGIATGAAGTATTQAGLSTAARQASEAARDVVLPAASQATTAKDVALAAAGTSTTKAAEAQGYAADARQYAALVGAAAFDFNFDSDPSTANDWNF